MMLKSRLANNRAKIEVVPEPDYPKMMKRGELVVLFQSYKVGTVVVSDGRFPVGLISQSFMMNDFKDLESTEYVTLWRV